MNLMFLELFSQTYRNEQLRTHLGLTNQQKDAINVQHDISESKGKSGGAARDRKWYGVEAPSYP